MEGAQALSPLSMLHFAVRAQVYLQKSTISNAVARSGIWSRKVAAAGGKITQVCKGPGPSAAAPPHPVRV